MRMKMGSVIGGLAVPTSATERAEVQAVAVRSKAWPSRIPRTPELEWSVS